MTLPASPATTRSARPSLPLHGLAWALCAIAQVGCHNRTASTTAPATAAVTSGAGTAVPRCPGDMVLVQPGEFTMGAADRRVSRDGLDARRQVVARPYCVERTEVPVEAYRRCVAAGACAEPVAFRDEHGNGDYLCNWNRPGADRHPANCVTWAKASAYCAWSGHEGGARRLPTEVEWEFAARGPEGRSYAWGTELSGSDRANLCGSECADHLHTMDWPAVTALPGWTDPSPLTSPVDAHAGGATPEGILNLTGNVGEWVAERYDGSTTPYSELRASDDGGIGVIRGASLLTSEVRAVHATSRHREIVTSYAASEGIRCVRDVL